MRRGLLCDGGRISLVGQSVHDQTEMLDLNQLEGERERNINGLLVRHQTQWVNLRHEDAGGDHVELDVDQEGTENIPDRGGSTELVLLMGYYIDIKDYLYGIV